MRACFTVKSCCFSPLEARRSRVLMLSTRQLQPPYYHHPPKMTVPKQPITHQWIRQTLVPFLLYAFVSELPHPADISEEIRRSIDFCLQKDDHPSDGDDFIFERIFMAVMHRHKNLAPDLEVVVDHLEPLAKFLIRRAQLKGPYELLSRSDVGSDAWVEYEQQKLSDLLVEPYKVKDGTCEAYWEASEPDLSLPELIPPVRPPTVPSKPLPTEENIDPRLVHAQPGQFTSRSLSTQLSAAEESCYRHLNREFEEQRSVRLQQRSYAPPVQYQNHAPFHLARSNAASVYGSPYRQELHSDPLPAQHTAPLKRAISAYCTPNTEQQLQPASSSPLNLSPCLPQYPASRHMMPQSRTNLYSPSQVNQNQPQLAFNREAFTGRLQTQTSWSDILNISGMVQAQSFAAVITPQQRDMVAQGIIQRQQSIAQKSPWMPSPMSVYSPWTAVQATPVRPYSAQPSMGYASDPRVPLARTASYASADIAKATSNSGTGSTQHQERTGLPTLEQVRSRYHPPHLQTYGQSQQMQPPRQPGIQVDAMQQLQQAAESRVRQSWIERRRSSSDL